MARGRHGDAAHAGRDHRHLRGQRLPGPHPGQPLRGDRRVDLGDHLLPRRQCHRHPHDRLAQPVLRAQAFPARLHCPVHRELLSLRGLLESPGPHLFPHPPGPCRRLAAADVAGHPARDLPAPSARHGHGDLRDRHHDRARHRAPAGGLDHRQLVVALGILHQYPHRDRRDPHGDGLHRRSRLRRGPEDEDRLHGACLPGRRDRVPPDRPGPGPARGLVRLPVHPVALRDLNRGTCLFRRERALRGRPHRRSAHLQEPDLCLREHHRLCPVFHALRQPDHAPHLPADPDGLHGVSGRLGSRPRGCHGDDLHADCGQAHHPGEPQGDPSSSAR